MRIAGLTPQSFSDYWTGAGEVKLCAQLPG